MPESAAEEEKRLLRELEGKNVAHYEVLLSAWIDNRMERDRTIITLSSAAIGLLVTIITTVHITGLWQCLFSSIALAGFLGSILICLNIYQINTVHLEQALRGEDSTASSMILENFDRWSIGLFSIGIVFSILMAIFISFQNRGGEGMAGKDKTQNLNESINGIKKIAPGDTLANSLNGVKSLSPQGSNKKSLEGVVALSPQNLQASSQNNSPKVSTQGNSGSKADK